MKAAFRPEGKTVIERHDVPDKVIVEGESGVHHTSITVTQLFGDNDDVVLEVEISTSKYGRVELVRRTHGSRTVLRVVPR